MRMIEKLNPQQQDALLCDTNCVVTAGAGSGKTTVLSYRFLRLVVEGRADVDGILTLTFSRAAAAEMHQRIHHTLSAYQDDPDIHAQLNRFSDATITTIDAFCNRIVASDPTRYGIGPDHIMDEEANREMAIECAHTLFSQIEGHPGLEFLATIYHPDELIDSLFVGLAFNQFHPSSRFDGAAQGDLLVDRIRKTYHDSVDQLLVLASKIIDLDGSGKTFMDNVTALDALLSRRESLEAPDSLSECLALLEAGKISKCRGKKDFVGVCNEFVDLFREELRKAKIACRAWCDEDLIHPIYEVLERYHSLYLATKRERGILTFGDVAHMARDILLHNRAVRSYFQRAYRYIMIDEFQDTNQLQKDLVYLLAQQPDDSEDAVIEVSRLLSDKLFFVGDEKQSIYRFRGADVSVFKTVGDEMIKSGGRCINLPCNYRSEPTLITCFNTLFEQVMADAHQPYEAQFERLEARDPVEGLTPSISVLFKPVEEEQDDPEEEPVLAIQAEAHMIARMIQTMVETDGYLIGEPGKVRRPDYKDIAILSRTSSNQMHYEKALRLAGIPYTLSAVQSLFLEAPANDIYHMLQLLVFPDDKLAFAAALRSPLCRLSDDALMVVLDTLERDSLSAFSPIPPGLLDQEDSDKYVACKDVYDQLLVLARGHSVASLVSHIWYEGGYRYYLLSDPLYQVYLEHFDFLHELAIQYDGNDRGLPAFLDYVRPRLGQNEKLSDVEPLRDHTEGVQLMTVHKSKGLEFPIVILANMGGEPRGGSSPAFVESGGLVAVRHMQRYDKVTNLIHELEKEELQRMETAEMKRLFYVALTRAKSHLVLAGCQNSRNFGEQAKDKNFLALLFDAAPIHEHPDFLGPDVHLFSIEDAPKSVLRASVSVKQMESTVDRMRPLYAMPVPPRHFDRLSMAVTSYAHRQEPSLITMEDSDEILLPSIEGDIILGEHQVTAPFGSWVHLLLQRAIERLAGTTQPSLIHEEEAQLLIPVELTRLGLPLHQTKILVSSALSLANNFLSSSFLVELLEEKPLSVESEVAFSMRWESPHGGESSPMVLHGSIDLLLRYETCIRVIDFKTDAFRQPQQHDIQLELYRKAAERLYGLPVHSTLCYLRDVAYRKWVTG